MAGLILFLHIDYTTNPGKIIGFLVIFLKIITNPVTIPSIYSNIMHRNRASCNFRMAVNAVNYFFPQKFPTYFLFPRSY